MTKIKIFGCVCAALVISISYASAEQLTELIRRNLIPDTFDPTTLSEHVSVRFVHGPNAVFLDRDQILNLIERAKQSPVTLHVDKLDILGETTAGGVTSITYVTHIKEEYKEQVVETEYVCHDIWQAVGGSFQAIFGYVEEREIK